MTARRWSEWFGRGFVLVVLALTLHACALSEEEKQAIFSKEWVAFDHIHPQRTVTIEGIRVVYVDVGRSRPDRAPLILLHGLAGSLNNWDFVIDALAKHRRVIALDLPGFGNSEKPAVDYTMAFYAKTVVGLLDALGIRRVHIVGNSMGGHIAATVAVDTPERVASLILVGAAGTIDTSGMAFMRRHQDTMENLGLWFAARAARKDTAELEELVERNLPVITEDKQPPGWMGNVFYEMNENVVTFLERQKPLILNVQSKEFPAFVHAVYSSMVGIAEASMDPRAGDITAPTLIVHGRQDRLVSLSAAQTYHRLIRSSLLRIIEKCGHLPQVEKPEEFIEIVEEFLADPRRAVEG